MLFYQEYQDEFFYFLDHLGFKDLFMGLDHKSKK